MKNSNERNEYFNSIYNKTFLVALSICCGILSCNFILFKYIFNNRYNQAHLFVPILVLSVIFNTISQFFGGIQISLKKPKANGFSTIIGAIVNIIVHLSLIKFIGLYAAAISTLASTICVTIIRKKMLKKEIDVSINKINYIYIIIYIYMTICSYFCFKIPPILNYINILIATIIFLIINKKYIIKILNKLKINKIIRK